jgi:hypothetical protein
VGERPADERNGATNGKDRKLKACPPTITRTVAKHDPPGAYRLARIAGGSTLIDVLLAVALSAVIGFCWASSPALAQEESTTTFEPTETSPTPNPSGSPASPQPSATVPTATSEGYPSGTHDQYSVAPPGGQLMHTGGVGLVPLAAGSLVALAALGLWAHSMFRGAGENDE